MTKPADVLRRVISLRVEWALPEKTAEKVDYILRAVSVCVALFWQQQLCSISHPRMTEWIGVGIEPGPTELVPIPERGGVMPLD